MSTLQPIEDACQPSDCSGFLSAEGGLSIYRTIRRDAICSAPNRPTLRAVNSTSKQVIFFQPACGSWLCPACARKNSRKAILRALHGYEVLSGQGHRIDFLTITSHPKLDPSGSYSVLAKAWDVLRKRIKRAAQHHDYFLVPEQHKDGRWHAHAITDAILVERWWKDNAAECGLGYMSDVSEVQSIGSVGGYVAKYTGKMLQNSNFPKGARRLRLSHTWPELPPMIEPEGWQFSTLPRTKSLQDEIDVLTASGHTVVMADDVSSWHWIDLMG